MTARRTVTADVAQLIIADAGTLTADTARRQITGLVLPYGTRANTSAGPTEFAPGSCRAAIPAHVALLVEHDRNRVAGYATRLDDTPTGLHATFTIPPGELGDQVLADAASGLRTGLSVGVDVTASTQTTDGALHVTAAALREVSTTPVPAWTGARVASVAASVPAQNGPAGAPAGGASTPPPAAASPPSPAVVPAAFYTAARPALDVSAVAQLVSDVKNGRRDPAELRAALTDVVPANDTGAGLLRPAWIGELWTATYAERGLVNAIGHQGLPATGLKVQGWAWSPKPGGGPYAGAKADIPSQAAGTVPAESPVERWAGGNDVDRVYLDRGDAGFVESYFRMMAADYALDTEAILSVHLLAAAADQAAGPTSILEVMVDAGAKLAAIGARLTFLAVSADLFGDLFGIKQSDAPWLLGGNASATDATGSVGGVSMFVEPNLAAGTVLAGDRRAATFYEDTPPIRVQAVNVAQGGVDLALFGYHATLVNDGRALLQYAVAPAGGATAASTSSKK